MTLSLYVIKKPVLSSINLVTTQCFFTPFLPLNTVSIILLLLGIIAELFDIKIGSGDFFYLASLSLFLDLESILWIVELGSW